MPKTYSDLFSEVRSSVKIIPLDEVKARLEADLVAQITALHACLLVKVGGPKL